jgi:hypothetical protein
MPLTTEQRVKFFVFVIESPSAADLYHRRGEGEIIKQAAELNGIMCVVKTAISLQAFEACLKFSIVDAMNMAPDCIPVVHISAHGNSHGIQLSDGYQMSWAELRDHLRPVNQAIGGVLVVCMSSCEGYSGIRMAMHLEDSELPYFALVGCGSQPTYSETAVGYATFYHQLWRGVHIDTAVGAMRVASGNNHFNLQHAIETRLGYIDFLKRVNPASARANLNRIVGEESAENSKDLLRLR